MSAAKHTPGPWWVTDYGVRDKGGYICQTIKATRYDDQIDRFVSETAERAANARLIAAAPELLEALRMVEQLAHCDSAREAAIRNTARAAIAKAEGKA